ncbi:GDP dissociation inhibitor-domain-containing protein [Lipomyces oligophaga]|uniref:GDP dissociation inhibitor-domain-containing protein n=1 Tax=Lipomyces oligophaga TaxID=45792 RepID=UPI0034CEB3D3
MTSSLSSPETCDVLVYGTGLVESIVAAALAWSGSNVVHIDHNPYYGGLWASLNLEELKTWTDQINSPDGNGGPYSNAYLYISRNLDSRKYAIDISPHIMFTRSDLLGLLVQSRVSRYLEFKPLGSFHTFEQDSFEKVPGTKEDIFTSQSLSLLTKRSLMRFMKFVVEWDSHPEIWRPYKGVPISQFLQEKFLLERPQIVEFVHSIALLSTPDAPTEVALDRIQKYLTSMGVYGPFPAMFSMYGSGGELAQGFCRSAAVAGAVYRLGTKLESFDEATGTAVLDNGERLIVAEKLITNQGLVETGEEVTRMVAVVEKDCKEWFVEGESAAIVVFPVDTLDGNKYAVQALVLGAGSGQVPSGQAVWYISTRETGEQGRKDLFLALEKMEESILRESTEDFEFDVSDEDVLLMPNGMPIISSVRLGESLRNFTPKESLKYLLKLTFTQKVTTRPPIRAASRPARASSGEDEISSSVETISGEPDSGKVLYISAPSVDIIYDGVLSEAKSIYESVTGSTDDFFDVDFEDEDDEDAGDSNTAAADGPGVDEEMVFASAVDDEVAGEMTI